MKKHILNLFAILLLSANCSVVLAEELNLRALLNDIKNYQCPHSNKRLSKNLITLSNSQFLISKICSANPTPKTCLSGVFSLQNEALGLANIAKNPYSAECNMSDEDKAQLIWYLNNYLNIQ